MRVYQFRHTGMRRNLYPRPARGKKKILKARKAALIAWTAFLFVLTTLSRAAPSARLRASSTRYGAAASGGLDP